MKVSPLKAGLTVLLLIGAVAALYVIFSALDNAPSGGGLTSYARGEMSAFRVVDNAPARPSTVLVDGEGGEVRLADFEGRVILVNFWATWCAPCVVEMPALNTLQAELGGPDFQVVTVSLDRHIDDAREFLEEHGLDHLPLLHDNTFASVTAVNARGLPMSILYDRRGREMGRVPNEADWASEDAFVLIRAAIAAG